MSKKSVLVAVALVICLVFTQGVFASEVEYPNEYRQFEVKESYPLAELFWFNPTAFCIDVLQFIQVYLAPQEAQEFYLTAANFSDEQIEEIFPIFQSFFQPEFIGVLDFSYSCDYELMNEETDYLNVSFDEEYAFGLVFEPTEFMSELFPRGIGRANAYDTFRRTALQLALYVRAHGTTPGAAYCSELIEQIIAFYQQQYQDAMQAEEEATGINPEAALEAAESAETAEPAGTAN